MTLNPYIAGKPVKGETQFFGRAYELDQLSRALSEAQPGLNQSYALVGPRRIGKTSIAIELIRRLKPTAHLTAFVNLQGEYAEPLVHFRAIEQALRSELRAKLPALEQLPLNLLDGPEPRLSELFGVFRDDLQRLDNAMVEAAHPLGAIILDEIMALNDLKLPAVFGFLRGLVQSFDSLIFVVIGSDELFTQVNDYASPFYNVFSILRVAPVADQDAQLMIVRPAEYAKFPVEEEAVRSVQAQAGNEPYLINWICREAVDRSLQNGDAGLRVGYVSAAIDAIVASPLGYFEQIWTARAAGSERLILYGLATAEGPRELAVIAVDFASSTNLELPLDGFEAMLEALAERQILRRFGGDYGFSNQLLPAWIRRHRTRDQALEGLLPQPQPGESGEALILRRLQLYEASRAYLGSISVRGTRPPRLDELLAELTLLFADRRVADTLAMAQQRALGAAVPLRLRLQLAGEDPLLARVRWELLRDPHADRFLAPDARLLLARSLPSDDPTPLAPRLAAAPSAVIAIAAPSDLHAFRLAPLDKAHETSAALKALAGYQTRIVGAATLDGIAEQLLTAPDLLFLQCHGTIRDDTPYLFLEQADGTAAPVDGAQLAELLRALPRRPHLVVLAACQSAGVSHDGSAARVALGPRLARIGVPAVLAMLDEVTLATTALAMPVLFEALLRHGEVDQATAVMRVRLAQSSADWWSPVLFLRVL